MYAEPYEQHMHSLRQRYDQLVRQRKELQQKKADCELDLLDNNEFYNAEQVAVLRQQRGEYITQLNVVVKEIDMLLTLNSGLREELDREVTCKLNLVPGGSTTDMTNWPEPQALPDGLLPVPPMSEKLIPEPLRPWLVDIAERMQCPLDFPTIGALVSFAGLVGRRLGIRPKIYDDWLVIPNLWGAVIGRPGIMKTPALAEAMKPLRRLEIAARECYERERQEHEFQKLVGKAKRDDLERKIKEAIRKGEDPGSFHDLLLTLDDTEPVLARYIVNDSTVEKLGELLNQNPYGLLLFRDELTGWLRTLDRDGHENDRAFYLEAWDGNSSYGYDRIGRGTLHIKAACVSILGGIQPGPLANYLRAAVSGGADDDGLMQRFQLVVYPDDPGGWTNIDRSPDPKARDKAFTIFQHLATRPVSDFGVTLVPTIAGVTVNRDEEIPFLRFDGKAQALFNAWRTDLEQKIRSPGEHPAIEAHLAKYRSLMPSLALHFHLLDVVDGAADRAVSEQATKLAAAWCDYLEAHARRIYQAITQRTLFAARKLAERIQAAALPTPFTLGAVLRKGWGGLTILDDLRQAADLLEELHWIRSERILPGEKGGRPGFHYHVNPAFPVHGKGQAA